MAECRWYLFGGIIPWPRITNPGPIRSASWDKERAGAGEPVTMIAEIERLTEPTNVIFEVYEKDLTSKDDFITRFEAQQPTGENITVRREWRLEHQEDVAGNPEYIFRVKFGDYEKESAGELEFTTFTRLRITGATQVGGPDSTNYVTVRANSGNVTIEPDFYQPPGADTVISWNGGTEVGGNPFQRTVSLTTAAQTTVSATVGPTTRSVNIWVVELTGIRVAEADVERVDAGGNPNSADFFPKEGRANAAIEAELTPASNPITGGAIVWNGGTEVVGNPHQRTVIFPITQLVTVTATVGNVTKTVKIWPRPDLVSNPNSPVAWGVPVRFEVANLNSDTLGTIVRNWRYEYEIEGAQHSITPPQAQDSSPTWGGGADDILVINGIVRVEIVCPSGLILREELAITVNRRIGANWTMGPVQLQPEQPGSNLPAADGGPLPVPPHQFQDLGVYSGRFSNFTIPANGVSSVQGNGPNQGIFYLTNITGLDASGTPYINDNVRNLAGNFMQAQDGRTEVYLIDHPNPGVRTLVDNIHITSINGNTVTFADTFDNAYGIAPGQQYDYRVVRRITAQQLLDNTRAHESGGAIHSHQANFSKLVRALDPKKYAEQLVLPPGTANPGNQFVARIEQRTVMILNAVPSHQIVDEAQSQIQQVVVFVPQSRMHGCNEDNATGNLLGDVWDITTNWIFPANP